MITEIRRCALQKAGLLVALGAAGIYLAANPAIGGTQAQAAPQFKVLALYNGTWDATHISGVVAEVGLMARKSGEYQIRPQPDKGGSIQPAGQVIGAGRLA